MDSRRMFEFIIEESQKHLDAVNETKADQIMRSIMAKMLELDDAALQDLNKEILNNTYKYMICFDMGCGNCSAMFAPINKASECDLVGWKYLDIVPSGRIRQNTGISIPTIIGYENAEPVIGPEAMLYGEIVENFKTIPTDTELKYRFRQVGDQPDVMLRQIWEDYFKSAFDMCLKSAQYKHDDITKSNVLFVVAHPADEYWRDELENYKDLISRGTGLEKNQIITFSEAKAAMQYVKSKNIALDWNRGVVIVDLGASTIDIEYIANNNVVPEEYSITMAGREVDRILGHYILEQWYPRELEGLDPDKLPDDDFFKKHEDEIAVPSKTRFAYQMRMIKEDVCSPDLKSSVMYARKNLQGQTYPLTINANDLEQLLDRIPFSFPCSDLGLAQFINGGAKKQRVTGTWYQHLEKLMAYVMTRLKGDGKPVNSVIVTGGTSRLVGVPEHIERGIKAAGMPEMELIVLDAPADYERTVPYGSFIYLNKTINKIPAMIEFPKKLKAVLGDELVKLFPQCMVENIYPYLEREMGTIFDKWAALPDGDPKSSDKGLTEMLRNKKFSTVHVQGAVDKAIIGMKSAVKNNTAVLAQSKQVISDFLKDLADDTGYQPVIDTGELCCDIPVEIVSNAVIKSCSTNGTYGQYVKGHFGLRKLKYILTNVNTPLSSSMRKTISENFKAENTIKYDILEPIKQEFKKAYDESEGDAFVDKLMNDELEQEINRALYLPDTQKVAVK